VVVSWLFPFAPKILPILVLSLALRNNGAGGLRGGGSGGVSLASLSPEAEAELTPAAVAGEEVAEGSVSQML
jgi:hypothetical protein